MSKSKKSDFRPNEYVVYPAHGVGQIVSIEKQEVAGFELELFVVSFEKDKMTLRVPTDKATDIGMRSLSSPDVVSQAMKTLKGKARVKRAMWSRPGPGIRTEDQLGRSDRDCRGGARSAPQRRSARAELFRTSAL